MPGNLLSKTDRKGQTIQYVYDVLNRLTQKTCPDSTSVEYVYDLVGKVQLGERSDRSVRVRVRQHGTVDRDHDAVRGAGTSLSDK